MLKKTYYSNGKNKFEDYIFSSQEWSAPAMVAPGEIRKRISSFKLEGRKIRKLRMIGLSYMLTRDWMHKLVWWRKESLPRSAKCRRSKFLEQPKEVPDAAQGHTGLVRACPFGK